MRDPIKITAITLGQIAFPLVPLPKKCVTKLPRRIGTVKTEVSISSTSEEVRDILTQKLGRSPSLLVSISSTSEEVRDLILVLN